MQSLMLRSRSCAIVTLTISLAACPAEPGEDAETTAASESGAMTTAASTDGSTSPSGTGGTSPAGTDDTGSATGGGPADCSYGGTPWTFLDELDMPRIRGVGREDYTCNPVTTDTVTLELQLDLPDGVSPSPSGSVRVLLFEANPDVADASADCVGGLCESLEGTSLTWSFELPNDQPDFTYYVSVDLDDGNGCILHEVDFVSFSPDQGTLSVPMTASDCI